VRRRAKVNDNQDLAGSKWTLGDLKYRASEDIFSRMEADKAEFMQACFQLAKPLAVRGGAIHTTINSGQ
jgi:hypothetical protein